VCNRTREVLWNLYEICSYIVIQNELSPEAESIRINNRLASRDIPAIFGTWGFVISACLQKPLKPTPSQVELV
jgi:hypothetical protein